MARKFFKVATFNLLNLAMPGQPYYNLTCDEATYKRKVEWVSAHLRYMNPDIVGFQEVFHPEALEEVITAATSYQNANILVADRPEDGGPSVALVSRFPVSDMDVIADFPEQALLEIDGMNVPIKKFSRPVLRAKLRLSDELSVTVYVAHLKSKRPKLPDGVNQHDPRVRSMGEARSLIVRAAEATALRHLLLDTLEGTTYPVIAMGDLNDDGESVTSRILVGEEPWRNLKLHDKQRLWDVHLYNVKDIQARQSYRDVYYTHIHNGHYDSLDHILVSQEFVRQNPQRLGYVEYVRVFNDHLIDETLSDDRVPRWASDHGQVVATIQLERGIPGEW